MPLTLEIPTDAITQLSRTDLCGISARFIEVSDEWGIKAYRSAWSRDNAYEKQQVYAEYGFAPPVGERFELGDYYCYATRLAETLIHPCASHTAFDNLREEYREEVEKVLNEMADYGLYPSDTHMGNWGYFEDELVFIDFDF